MWKRSQCEVNASCTSTAFPQSLVLSGPIIALDPPSYEVGLGRTHRVGKKPWKLLGFTLKPGNITALEEVHGNFLILFFPRVFSSNATKQVSVKFIANTSCLLWGGASRPHRIELKICVFSLYCRWPKDFLQIFWMSTNTHSVTLRNISIREIQV